MENKSGIYSLAASVATSVIVVILFYIFAAAKIESNPEMYKSVDVYAGIVYVFILSMIVSASIWPGVIEKILKRE